MKTLTTRPYKRQIMFLLFLVSISGCSAIQSNKVYQSWEQRAYRAYQAPVKQVSILPSLFNKVSLPGTASYQKASTTNLKPVAKANPPESRQRGDDYIEQYYGL